jgi:hypothetical protein
MTNNQQQTTTTIIIITPTAISLRPSAAASPPQHRLTHLLPAPHCNLDEPGLSNELEIWCNMQESR